MGYFNAHGGVDRKGEEAHGLGERNQEGVRLVDFAVSNNLSIINTFYAQRELHKWS